LRPFSEKLRVDEKLKLSRENFISRSKISSKKDISPLKPTHSNTHFFHTPRAGPVCLQSIHRQKTGETETQYETRLTLTDDWKLLTTASNSRWNNGYFGAAYWHPEHQQVVIAHRGTKLTNFGSLWTDAVGVVFENHVLHMGSASTFELKVVEVLEEFIRL
jgi:hypothetical protein